MLSSLLRKRWRLPHECLPVYLPAESANQIDWVHINFQSEKSHPLRWHLARHLQQRLLRYPHTSTLACTPFH